MEKVRQWRHPLYVAGKDSSEAEGPFRGPTQTWKVRSHPK